MYFSVLFFSLFFLYEELLLFLAQPVTPVWPVLLCLLPAAAAAGLLSSAILSLFRNPKLRFGLSCTLLALFPVLFLAEILCREFFGTYYEVGYMLSMSGSVAGHFAGAALHVIATNAWRIPLAFLPLVLYLIPSFRSCLERPSPSPRPGLFLAGLVFCLLAHCACLSSAGSVYTTQYNMNSAVPRFGLLTSVRLELQYALFGQPSAADSLSDFELPVVAVPEPSVPIPTETSDDAPSSPPEENGETEEVSEPETEAEVSYGFNALDIDFQALAAGETNDTLRTMHELFGSLTPTQQNEYTGRFAGKNLIFLTAEAFSPYVISEELTPTLYRLSTEGFVFTNYYQPSWFQSTTGGEFANMTGLTATWIGQKLSFTYSISDFMPFALGNQFRSLGYTTLAYHNNSYTYYNRNLTHPNLGYDFYGIGNGLELASTEWPCSDLEMMEATVPGYIDRYLETGTPFHVYYMTVSGHCNYGWNINAMSEKNRALVEGIDASETVKAYLACNLELEAALTYLLDELEAAGIAEDTVIVMGADHYPYALTQNSPVDYYRELSGINDTEDDTSRYRNTLILWCGDMEEPVVVDTPCSSIDLVPTLSNLFGLAYDSRLLSGTDIFAENYDSLAPSFNMPLVIFIDGGYGTSWSTAAGTYEARTGTFTPNEGYTVDDTFISSVTRIAETKHLFSKLIIANDYYRAVLPEGTGP